MSLKESAVSGVRWTTLSASVTALLQATQLVVLARLLEPFDFGLMAMALVVIGFSQAYSDMGVSAAIVHRQDTTSEQLSSLYWLNIIAGILIFFLILVATPFVVMFFHEPRLGGILPVVAIGILISSISLQFHWLLEKELRFDLLAKQEIISTVFGVSVAVGSAFLGFGVWSLVWGQLATAGTKTILLIQVGWANWSPRFHFSKKDLEGYLSFGLYQMAERSINYFNSKVDQLLVGYLLGARELGYYNFAFILVLEPVSRINPIITRVAFPVFSKIQQDIPLLQYSYIKMLNLLSSVNAPMLIGLIAVAPIIIPVIFGPQWIPAILLIQILGFFSLIRSTGNPVGSLLLAKGRADLGFRWNLALFFITTPVIYMGAKIGNSIGIAIALVLLQIFYSSANYKYLVEPLIGKCVRQYVLSIFKPSIFALIMGACVWLLTFSGMKSVAWLAIYVLSGATIYILLLWFFDRGIVLEFKGLFGRAE